MPTLRKIGLIAAVLLVSSAGAMVLLQAFIAWRVGQIERQLEVMADRINADIAAIARVNGRDR